MLRAMSVLVALILLTGMSREQVLRRMEGNWQATSEAGNWTTASAFAFNADLGFFDGNLAEQRYKGEVKTLVVIGKRALLTFDGSFTVSVGMGKDNNTLAMSINGKKQLQYRRIEAPPAP